jgi:hypothetical protein
MEGGPDAAPDQSSGDSGVQGDNGQDRGSGTSQLRNR